jgi:hypothetical protein
MRRLALALVLLSFCAHAELYRWVDRESGSVRYSNTPPPWYGDPAKERVNPPVEVLRYDAPGTAAKPTPKEESARITAATIASMEARWRELTKFFASLPPSTDFARPAEGLRSQIEAYQTLSRELDRLDPGGAERRRAQRPPGFDAARERLQ